MIYFPNCKINIGLDILRRRDDGYHDIDTLMYPVKDLCDSLEVVPDRRSRSLTLSCSGNDAGCPPEKNLVFKAWEEMDRQFGIGGARAHLHKMIPAGAGLGGGSSDAAFMIRGLNEIFSLGLDNDAMCGIAARLGSDVPFFIRNVPAMCSSRGEVMEPYPIDLDKYAVIVEKPQAEVSTSLAYAMCKPHVPSRPLRERLSDGIESWQESVVNAFEQTVFPMYPQIRELKESMTARGALYASMSGSGSAVYGIFRKTDL